jgi:hypothetical protein
MCEDIKGWLTRYNHIRQGALIYHALLVEGHVN